MKKLTMMIVALMAIFAVQSVAEAASISKRVRVLEVKVSKQNKLIRQQTRATQKQTAKLDKGLKEMEELRLEVERFMRRAELKKKKKSDVDWRYAYP